MSKEISGIPLKAFEDPIWDVLQTYELRSEDRVEFDLDAIELEAIADKPYSARSQSPVKFDGEQFADLYVIAFEPGDGTGNDNDYQLNKFSVEFGYPRASKIVPRRKLGIHSELWLPLAMAAAENPSDDIIAGQGELELMGVNILQRVIQRFAHLSSQPQLGHNLEDVNSVYTVGYYNSSNRRFGDPHAVYNAIPDRVQVCGFLALSDDVYRQKGEEPLDVLSPRFPYVAV